MNLENKKILVVEDEFITAADLVANLELMGFVVPASTDTGEEVLDLAKEHMPDLILMDINLKGEMNGIEAADIVKKQLDIPVVFLTGQSDEATISKAIMAEPFGYIIKPFDDRNLKTIIAMALYKHSIDLQLKASENRYRMIAESSDNLISILNSDATIDYINLPGCQILKKDLPSVIGHSLSDILISPIRSEMEKQIHTLSHTSGSWNDRIKITVDDREIWMYSTIISLLLNNSSPGQVLWIAKDITEWVEMQQKMQKEGLIQLEKNMERFQILNDEIRNPLTLISSYASMDESPSSEMILFEVKKIDNLVNQLDKGWVESNKVRSFLLRHYRHGEEL